MKKMFSLICALTCFCSFTSGVFANPYGLANNGMMGQNNQNYKLSVNNRILAKINGKSISVMDIKKKMDIFLSDKHPDAVLSPMMRYQFYMQNWKDVLQEQLNSELMLMEADDMKIEIADGDIREEMESRFGPNVIAKIESLGLTYEEAKNIVREDIIVRNLAWFRIWARVMQLVTPDSIVQGYKEHLANLPQKDEWVYQTLTVKGAKDAPVEEFATQAHAILKENNYSNLAGAIAAINATIPKNISVNVSDELHLQSKELSPEYQTILSRLSPESFSEPVRQVSRSDGSVVYRIFHLKEYQQITPPSFDELASTIRTKVMQKCAETQSKEYYAKLRKRFCCEDLVASKFDDPAFQPFSLTI